MSFNEWWWNLCVKNPDLLKCDNMQIKVSEFRRIVQKAYEDGGNGFPDTVGDSPDSSLKGVVGRMQRARNAIASAMRRAILDLFGNK